MLPCNVSMNIYPDNHISNYKTRLARSMNLKGLWEVGLIELYYPITWYTFNDGCSIYYQHGPQHTGV